MHSFMQRTGNAPGVLLLAHIAEYAAHNGAETGERRVDEELRPARAEEVILHRHRAHFLEQRTNLRELCVRNALHAAHMERKAVRGRS